MTVLNGDMSTADNRLIYCKHREIAAACIECFETKPHKWVHAERDSYESIQDQENRRAAGSEEPEAPRPDPVTRERQSLPPRYGVRAGARGWYVTQSNRVISKHASETEARTAAMEVAS